MLQRPDGELSETCQRGSDVPADLLTRLNEAVAATNAAEQTVTTAKAELVSRSKAVGSLLLEAKKLQPAVKDFEAFLKHVNGLKLSRAYDYMRLAGGRTTDEKLKQEQRDRQAKSRAKKKLSKPEPKPEPKPDSVTVTEKPALIAAAREETAEDSAERRKTENADLSLSSEEGAARRSNSLPVRIHRRLPQLFTKDHSRS